jgi:hypothetical protein
VHARRDTTTPPPPLHVDQPRHAQAIDWRPLQPCCPPAHQSNLGEPPSCCTILRTPHASGQLCTCVFFTLEGRAALLRLKCLAGRVDFLCAKLMAANNPFANSDPNTQYCTCSTHEHRQESQIGPFSDDGGDLRRFSGSCKIKRQGYFSFQFLCRL